MLVPHDLTASSALIPSPSPVPPPSCTHPLVSNHARSLRQPPQESRLMAAAAAEPEGAGACAVARIFVGGLAAGVAAADLETMFASVGRVAGVELVRTNGRSFAYVDFHCPSDRALAKLFSTYNGCKWKGGKLRLEKAKEHYLSRLKREWGQDAAAAAEEIPVKDIVEKQEEKRKPEKTVLDSSKINIYFPKLRKVKALPFKGTGKHKYSFRHIEVPSYPIHFCDCEEHCGPPEAADDEYASVLNAAAYEKERNIMNSVMSKLFEGNEHFDSLEMQKRDVDVNTTEPSDAENDLQMEETEETPEEDLGDLQMEETEEPSEEDDLVINIVTRKTKNSLVQLNREKQAVNKDSWFRKRQQLEETSPQKKIHKSDDLSEPRNKKQSTSMMLDRTPVKSLPVMSRTIQNEQKYSGLSGKGKHEFSSKLDRDNSSAGLLGVEALTGSSTKNETAQNVHATEPKKGSLWTQKSAWRDLVGGMGATSFSISQVLPNTNPAPPKLQNATETSASRSDTKRKVKLGVNSSKSLEPTTQVSPEQKLPSSIGMPSSKTTIGSAGHDTGEHNENNKLEKVQVVPKITIGEVCPFMRNTESEKQWSKAKKALTGFMKKSNENTGSNIGKGKPPSRR